MYLPVASSISDNVCICCEHDGIQRFCVGYLLEPPSFGCLNHSYMHGGYMLLH